MTIDEKLLSQIEYNRKNCEYRLEYQDRVYSLEDVTITKSTMPVNKPTIRGGVYSINDKEYKIKGTVNDLSLLPFISSMMLGPNTEFQEIRIKIDLKTDLKSRSFILFTYLTNAMNNSSKIIFNFLIVGVKIE